MGPIQVVKQQFLMEASSSAYISRQGTGCNCNFITGSVDEVRIRDDVRTQSEIQGNMNIELESEGNLVG